MLAFGEKVPDPLVDQRPVILPPVTEPFKVCDGLEAQTLALLPAFTNGGGCMVRVIELETGVQPFVLVSVRVRDPAEISAALGV